MKWSLMLDGAGNCLNPAGWDLTLGVGGIPYRKGINVGVRIVL